MVIAIAAFFAIGCSITYLITCTFLSAWVLGLGRGNEGDAQKWLDRFKGLPDPESAKAAYPDVDTKRFPNGEWVFGVSTDSHHSHWGGTLVIKDSDGRVSAWFGHVCGQSKLLWMSQSKNSLREFYFNWEEFGLKEYVPQ